VRSSNPVLTRLGEAARQHMGNRSGGYGIASGQAGPGQAGPWQPTPGQPAQGGYPYQAQPGGYPYGYPPAPQTPDVLGAAGRAMTLDDVVMRTVGLLLLTGIAGAAAWVLLPNGPIVGLAVLGSALAGLVLGLVIAFARITNPVLIALYAVVQGVLLGVVSRFYEERFHGIVLQAVAATFCVFFGMAVLYKLRILRATPRFTKFLLGALIGFVLLSLVNWVVYLFGGNLGLVDYNLDGSVSFVPILFAIIGVVIGALTFILDFAEVENGVRYGLPEKYAWYCAFGLLVGLIFLYWQILRLLGYMRR
jgi:uncharacterized YccA/Bax inhibitor family protein